jgi:hypothetical protein
MSDKLTNATVSEPKDMTVLISKPIIGQSWANSLVSSQSIYLRLILKLSAILFLILQLTIHMHSPL